MAVLSLLCSTCRMESHSTGDQRGGVIAEAALICPFIFVLLFVSIECLEIYRTSYALQQIAHAGAEAAETAPSLRNINMTVTNVYDLSPNASEYELCTNDYFILPNSVSVPCGHIAIQTFMFRAYVAYSKLLPPLNEMTFISSSSANGITVEVSMNYKTKFNLGALSIFGYNLSFDSIKLSGRAASQNFFAL